MCKDFCLHKLQNTLNKEEALPGDGSKGAEI